jgi:hypothetical protein
MIFKKFCDYGGYSYGWKCLLCGEIIDEIPENRPLLKEYRNENKKVKSRDLMMWKMGIERS